MTGFVFFSSSNNTFHWVINHHFITYLLLNNIKVHVTMSAKVCNVHTIPPWSSSARDRSSTALSIIYFYHSTAWGSLCNASLMSIVCNFYLLLKWQVYNNSKRQCVATLFIQVNELIVTGFHWTQKPYSANVHKP